MKGRNVISRLSFFSIALAIAVPAAAQQPGLQLGQKQIRSLFAAEAPNAAPALELTPRAQGGDGQYIFTVHGGGMWFGSGNGLVLGGDVHTRPFNNPQVEIAANFSFVRFEGFNGVYISGNGLYHFKTSEKFSPFAGAGLGILHLFDETEVRFQIAGGIEFNANGPNPIRPELRFIFTEGDTTTLLLVSIGVARR